MKLAVLTVVALSGSLVAGSPVNTVAKSARASNLLQSARATSASDSHKAASGAACIPPFCPWSNLPGGEGSSGTGYTPEFFTKDFEKMDELPAYDNTNPKHQCHPKCRWTCGTTSCDSLCKPRCKAPKCVTACKKINLSGCKRTCKDPQCAVVCPPQCSTGTCPKCKTVCGESVCQLQCGKGQCESSCADPDCVWDCKPNPACAKPQCKMICDAPTPCAFGKDVKLPNDHEVPYLGEEIAWKGLGKIPGKDFADFTPKTFAMPKLLEGAKLMPGAQKKPLLLETGNNSSNQVDIAAHTK